MEKQKVMVAILAGDSTNHAALSMLAFRLPYLSSDPGHPFAYGLHIEPGVRPQEYARNVICGVFLKSPADILLQIDNDMIAGAEALTTLLATPEYDIAAPMQFMWWPLNVETTPPRMPQCYAVAGMFDGTHPNKIQPMTPLPGTEVSAVDWVGSGCIAIKRKVLEDPRMHLARNLDPPALWRNVYLPNGDRTSGLDIDFCRRAKRAGYAIKVNWRAEVGHWKHVDLNQVEMYQKLAFRQGCEIGAKHAAQVASIEGRPDEGGGGVAEPDRGGNGELAGVEVGRGRLGRLADRVAGAIGGG